MDSPKPFGLWESPISPTDLAEATRFGDVRWSPDGDRLVWLEGRGGCGVIVDARLGQPARDVRIEASIRAEVGYGGGDFTVGRAGYFYAKKGEAGLHRWANDGDGERELTGRAGNVAGMCLSADETWVACVEELGGNRSLLLVAACGDAENQVVSDEAEFYMQPSFSPSGRYLTWIEWDHPNMPWDGTRLMLARLDSNGVVVSVEQVAGGASIGIFQPVLSDDALYFISDESGWSQLWRAELTGTPPFQVSRGRDERGLPAWIQGMRTFALSADGRRALMVVSERGADKLMDVSLTTGEERVVQGLEHFTELLQPALSPDGSMIGLVVSGPRDVSRVVCLGLESGKLETLAVSCKGPEREAMSQPDHVTWSVSDGEEVHGIFYPPHGEGAEPGALPPLVVMVHGGPTAQATTRFSGHAQFFATRGYAVLAVNYRGSTGYGRAYRERLAGEWGVMDVADVVAGAEFLSREGRVDPTRRVIMGGSAGGYTVLQAMVHYPDVFTAGVCSYAVTDLFELVAETHDFEAHYVDGLVGVLPGASALFRERSPVFHASRIERPLAIFQGADDEVVPPSQAEAVVQALSESGVSYTYRLYEEEGHGFRRRETIADFFDTIDAFLRRHMLKTLRT